MLKVTQLGRGELGFESRESSIRFIFSSQCDFLHNAFLFQGKNEPYSFIWWQRFLKCHPGTPGSPQDHSPYLWGQNHSHILTLFAFSIFILVQVCSVVFQWLCDVCYCNRLSVLADRRIQLFSVELGSKGFCKNVKQCDCSKVWF